MRLDREVVVAVAARAIPKSATFAAYALFEGAAGYVLHDDVVRPVLRAAPVVDQDYVRVAKGGGALRLTPKAFDELVVLGVLVFQDLERHIPFQNLIVGQVDLGHTSAA